MQILKKKKGFLREFSKEKIRKKKEFKAKGKKTKTKKENLYRQTEGARTFLYNCLKIKYLYKTN